MTRRIVPALVAVLTAFGGAQTPPQTPAPGNLAAVIGVMKDSASTPAQKQALVGKVYSGFVSVQAVRLSEQDRSLVTVDAIPAAEPGETPSAATIVLRYVGSADDEKIGRLYPNQRVKFRGRLKELSVKGSASWAHFTDLVIE